VSALSGDVQQRCAGDVSPTTLHMPQNSFTGRPDFIQLFLNAEAERTAQDEIQVQYDKEALRQQRVEKYLTTEVHAHTRT
jgi:hypothetical protein